MTEKPISEDPLTVVRSYHDRTKHHLHRYAQSLGYMDWSTQPNPFRSYDGAECLPLLHPPLTPAPTYEQLFSGKIAAQPWSHSFLSRLFYDSLAISAWKQAGHTKPWSLRINPSSGALQPTESYLIAGPIANVSSAAAVYHYNVYRHALEKRVELLPQEWDALAGQFSFPCVFVGLASIYWRESWKYGERAFRYCHHDVGHAIGAVAFAARLLGWQAYLLNTIADEDAAVLLGIHEQHGIEAEHPDGLLLLCPGDVEVDTASFGLPAALVERLRKTRFAGSPNQLSKRHHEWTVIDEVSLATQHGGAVYPHPQPVPCSSGRGGSHSAEQIIRQRRSAVDMDGTTSIDSAAFYQMMQRVLPSRPFPFAVLPWRPLVALAVFVHRVSDLDRGLYMLVRDPAQRPSLLTHCRSEFEWRKPAGCPSGLELYLLLAADTRKAAKTVSCHQDIAADGAFSLGMLAEFDAALAEFGPSIYPRLFWETGLIGQVLYLEAEAAGIRATGIGCFFDDAMHDVLGLGTHAWQSLYHFTVGGAVEDVRLRTMAPYEHLETGEPGA